MRRSHVARCSAGSTASSGPSTASDSALTLHELTERTGLPKSTVHRMVDQLVTIGWIERDVAGYRIGMRLFEIGGLASRRSRLSDLAYPHLHALSVATGLAVQMAILDGTDVVYLERIPMRGLRLPTRQGGRQPAYCTALGKAMLAFDPDAASEALAEELPERTSRTLTAPRDLEIELERIAETGLAFDHQESYEGLACVAAPLRGSGRAIGAVSVTGPVARIDLHGRAARAQHRPPSGTSGSSTGERPAPGPERGRPAQRHRLLAQGDLVVGSASLVPARR